MPQRHQHTLGESFIFKALFMDTILFGEPANGAGFRGKCVSCINVRIVASGGSRLPD